MSLIGTVNLVISAGGQTIQGVVSRQATGGVPPQAVALAAGNAGTLTTRTNDTDGEITAADAGHDIETGDKIDIGWIDANGKLKVAYGGTVGTVSGTSIPFTGCSGEVLPAQDYSVIVDERVPIDCDFDGDKALIIAACCDQNGHCAFEDSGSVVLDTATLYAKEPYLYYSDSNISPPITGNPVDELQLSNLSVIAATFRLCGLVQSDT